MKYKTIGVVTSVLIFCMVGYWFVQEVRNTQLTEYHQVQQDVAGILGEFDAYYYDTSSGQVFYVIKSHVVRMGAKGKSINFLDDVQEVVEGGRCLYYNPDTLSCYWK